jgi:hypothetical protein
MPSFEEDIKEFAKNLRAEGVTPPSPREGRANPSEPVLSPGEETRQLSRAREIRERERETRPLRLLEAQEWRCAMACGGNGEGRPMLPGEPFAYIDDHEAIVHVDCLKAGTVPSEGNPWTINGARRSRL